MENVKMQIRDAEIIDLKKIKKDGSISEDLVTHVAGTLSNGGIVIAPIDNIYAVIGLAQPDVEKKIVRIIKKPGKRFVRLISSFKMLDDLAMLTKVDYDFLNRIWPGEVTVILRRRNGVVQHNSMAFRFPRSKYMLSIISRVDMPLIFANCYRGIGNYPIFRKGDIVRYYRQNVDLILIIDEFCRRHPRSTIIDITENNLKIVREGRISSEEIKSLYFLGKDDIRDY